MSKSPKPSPNNRPEYVCYCNRVGKDVIENAIVRGCDTLPKIFDATTAGVGACGGSCRPYLIKMLKSYYETGKFPENLRPHPATKRRNR